MPAKHICTIENAKIEFGSPSYCALQWESGDKRFHIWLDPDTGAPKPNGWGRLILYVNPRTACSRSEPGYFPTKHLDQNAKAHSPMIALAFRLANTFEDAKAAFIAEQEKESAAITQAAKEREARERLHAAAEEMLATLKEALEVLQNIDVHEQHYVTGVDPAKAIARVQTAISRAENGY